MHKPREDDLRHSGGGCWGYTRYGGVCAAKGGRLFTCARQRLGTARLGPAPRPGQGRCKAPGRTGRPGRPGREQDGREEIGSRGKRGEREEEVVGGGEDERRR